MPSTVSTTSFRICRSSSRPLAATRDKRWFTKTSAASGSRISLKQTANSQYFPGIDTRGGTQAALSFSSVNSVPLPFGFYVLNSFPAVRHCHNPRKPWACSGGLGVMTIAHVIPVITTLALIGVGGAAGQTKDSEWLRTAPPKLVMLVYQRFPLDKVAA